MSFRNDDSYQQIRTYTPDTLSEHIHFGCASWFSGSPAESIPSGSNPHISPIRLLPSYRCLLSMSYGSLLTTSTSQTALDAPSLVFLPPAGTCSLRPSPCLQHAEPAPVCCKPGGKLWPQPNGRLSPCKSSVLTICPSTVVPATLSVPVSSTGQAPAPAGGTNLPGADLDVRRTPCAPWRAHI